MVLICFGLVFRLLVFMIFVSIRFSFMWCLVCCVNILVGIGMFLVFGMLCDLRLWWVILIRCFWFCLISDFGMFSFVIFSSVFMIWFLSSVCVWCLILCLRFLWMLVCILLRLLLVMFSDCVKVLLIFGRCVYLICLSVMVNLVVLLVMFLLW